MTLYPCVKVASIFQELFLALTRYLELLNYMFKPINPLSDIFSIKQKPKTTVARPKHIAIN